MRMDARKFSDILIYAGAIGLLIIGIIKFFF